MSDNSQKFEIRITTPAELSGAIAVEQQLQRDIGKAKALGKEYSDLQTQLDRVRGVIDDYKKSHSKLDNLLDQTTLKHKELRKIILGLNSAIPGLGVLFQAAFSPIGAAISIAMIALEKFKDAMREWNEEMDRTAEEAAKPLSNRIDEIRRTTVETSVATAELTQRLREAGNSQKSFAQQMSETVEKLKSENSATQDLSNALQTKELAQLNLLHAAGLVSTTEYEARKFAIEESYAQKKRALQDQLATAEIMVQRRLLENAQADQQKLEDQATDALGKMTAAQERTKSVLASNQQNAEKLAKDKSEFDTFQNKNSELIDVFEQLGHGANEHQRAMAALKTNTGENEFNKLYDKWVKLETDLSNEKHVAAKADKNETEARIAESQAKSASDRASKRAEENRSYVATQQPELERKISERDIRRQTAQQEGQLEHDTHTTNLAASWTQRRSELQGKNSLNPNESSELNYLNGAMGFVNQTQSHQSQAQQILQSMSRTAQSSGNITATLNQIMGLMENQAAQMNNLNGRIKNLSSQIKSSRSLSN